VTTTSLVRTAVALAILSSLLTVAALILMAANDFAIGGTFWPASTLVGIVYPIVGARVVAREPRNRVGWLLLIGAGCWTINNLAEEYAWFAYTSASGLPAAPIAAWLSQWVWLFGTAALLILMPIYFPDGHLPSRRWIPMVIAIGGVTLVTAAGQAALTWAYRDDVALLIHSNYDPTEDPRVTGTVVAAIVGAGDVLIFLVGIPSAAVAVVARWRSSVGIPRLQIRWFASAMAVAALFIVASVTPFVAMPDAPAAILSLLAMTLPAIAIGIAILRYHLYDIDRVVSRTLAYALVTGTLVAIYFGVNLGLTTLFSSAASSNSIAVAASTLVVAAAFTPLRRRVRHLVDRRFDRARYDGERTAAAFSDRMRDAMDLPGVAADLDSTVRAAMAPTRLGLWLRERPA